jgi:hypothetical protein
MFRSEAAILADLKHSAIFALPARQPPPRAAAQLVPRGSLFSRAREGASGPAVTGEAAGERAWDCVRDASPRGGQTFHRDLKSLNFLLDGCARSATSGRRAEHAGDGRTGASAAPGALLRGASAGRRSPPGRAPPRSASARSASRRR